MMLTGRMWFLLLFCLQSDIFKLHDGSSAFVFGQYITTNRESFCSQGTSLDLCQILPTQIFMEKCINNGEFDTYTLWKGNTIRLHLKQAVFLIFSNEKGIYHGGELNLREFYRFQPTVNKGITKLHGHTFAKGFYLQPSDVKLLTHITVDFYNNASNFNEVYEINYRDIVIFFCFNLHWTCMFILLI